MIFHMTTLGAVINMFQVGNAREYLAKRCFSQDRGLRWAWVVIWIDLSNQNAWALPIIWVTPAKSAQIRQVNNLLNYSRSTYKKSPYASWIPKAVHSINELKAHVSSRRSNVPSCSSFSLLPNPCETHLVALAILPKLLLHQAPIVETWWMGSGIPQRLRLLLVSLSMLPIQDDVSY